MKLLMQSQKRETGAPVDEDDEGDTERMSSDDAWLFPIVGPCCHFLCSTHIELDRVCSSFWALHYRQEIWDGVDKFFAWLVFLHCRHRECLAGL